MLSTELNESGCSTNLTTSPRSDSRPLVYHSDNKALSTARFRHVGLLVTYDTCDENRRRRCHFSYTETCSMTHYPVGPHLTSCERLCYTKDHHHTSLKLHVALLAMEDFHLHPAHSKHWETLGRWQTLSQHQQQQMITDCVRLQMPTDISVTTDDDLTVNTKLDAGKKLKSPEAYASWPHDTG